MVSSAELIVSIIGDMEGLKKVFRDVQTEISGMGSKMSSMGKDLSSAGSSMTTGITAPILAVGASIGLATSESTKFDTELRRTATMLPGITNQGFKEIGAQSLALSKQFGSDTTDINNAMYNALSSNVPEDNIFSFMQTSEKLAIGGMTDVFTSVDGLTSVVNAYGQSNLSAAHAADVMFTGSKYGKATIEELSKQLADVTPIAAANKVSFEDLNSVIATMTIQGTRTPVAMTQTKAILNELSQDSTQAGAAFKQLAGESFTEFIAKGGTVGEALALLNSHVGETIPDVEAMNKAVQGFQDPASEMSQKFNELTGQSFQQFTAGGGTVQQALKLMGMESGTTTKSVADFFSNIEGKSGALQLVGEGGKLYTQTMEAMQTATGATDQAYNMMAEGMGTQTNIMEADFKAFVIEAGNSFMPVFKDTIVPFVKETLIPALNKMIPVIVSIMQAFGNLSPTLQLLILGLIGLLAAAGPVLMIIGAMASGIGAIAALFATGGLLASGGAIMTALGAAIGLLSAPITILIGVVALLAIAWARDWGGIREKAAAVWDFIQTTANTLYQRLEYTYHSIIMSTSTLRTNLDTIWNILSSAFTAVVNLIISLVTAWYNNVKNNFNLIMAAAQALLNAWRTAWASIQTALSSAKDLIISILNTLYSTAQGIFNRIVAGVQALLTSWRSTWATIQTATSTAQTAVTGVLNTLFSAAQGVFNRIVAAVQTLLNDWRNRWTQIQNIVSDAKDYISNYLTDLYNTVVRRAGEIATKLTQPFSDIKNKILGYATDWYNAGTTILDNLYNGVVDGFNKVIKKAKEELEELRGYLPFSPAKWGPFSKLPNWDTVFADPMQASISRMGGTVEAGLSSVAGTVNKITNTSGAVSNINYEGSSINIGPNNLSNQLDIQALVDEINRRATAQRRARGYIL